MDFVYDNKNIFAKILRGEIPNDTVYENEHALAFRDIQPQAPVHVLVIPKGPYMSYDHFCRDASDAEIAGFHRAIAAVCAQEDVTNGFRAIANAREDAVQEVPHFHMHIIGGRMLGPILPRA